MRDNYKAFQDRGVSIFGVSFDDVATQKKFVEKEKLPFTLIADPEGKVVKAFGVPSRGKFASRQAYLVRDGKVVWADTSASTGQQAADALAALESLK